MAEDFRIKKKKIICFFFFLLNLFFERYNPYTSSMNSYDSSNGYTYTPNVMTLDLGNENDFVDSTTFDQRQGIDSVPNSNGLLPNSVCQIINNPGKF